MALWTPDDLETPPTIWVKADSIVANDNDLLTTWPDDSGNGNDLAAISSQRPTYRTNQQNGLPAVKFDPSGGGGGGSNSMTKAVTGLSQPEHLVFVARPDSALTTGLAMDGAASDMRWQAADTSGNYFIYAGGTTVTVGFTADQFAIVSALFNGASSEYRKNGGTSASVGNVGAFNGGGLTLGSSRSGGGPCRVSFAEVVFADYVLTTDERQRIEGYLAWKWGLQADLPADHPYKASAPTTDSPVTDRDLWAKLNFGTVALRRNLPLSTGAAFDQGDLQHFLCLCRTPLVETLVTIDPDTLALVVHINRSCAAEVRV